MEEMKREFEEKFMLGESLANYDSYFERDADTIRELYAWFESKLKQEIESAKRQAKIEALEDLRKYLLANDECLVIDLVDDKIIEARTSPEGE